MITRKVWRKGVATGLLGAVFFCWNAGAAIWDGGGTSDLWSDGLNWVGDVAPSNPSGVVLQFGGTLRLTPNVDSPWTILGLQFLAGSGAFVIGGQELTVGGSGIVNNSMAGQTIGSALQISSNQTWNAFSGNLTLSGVVNTAGFALTLSAASGRTLTVSGPVSGTGALTKTGSGTLTLGGTNTYGGGSILSAGTVVAGSNSAFGTGNVTLAGASLNSPAVRTLSNLFTMTASTTFTGSNLTLSNPLTLAANSTLTVSNGFTTLAAGLVQSGGPRNFTKGGTGTLIVQSVLGSNGTVSVSGGVLALGVGATLPGSNLILTGGVLATNGTFSRPLGTAPGAVSFAGTVGGFSAYGGPLTINGFTGTPVWGATPSFLTAGTTLRLGSNVADALVTWTNDFSLGTGNRTIDVPDNAASTADGAIVSGLISGSGNLIKNGTGPLTLTGNNSFTGQVAINGGSLQTASLANVGLPSPLGAASGPAATIRIGTGSTSGTLVYTGTGHSTDRPLELRGSTGGALLSADGSGAAVFTGPVTAGAAGNKTLTLTGNSTAPNMLSGPISNGAGVIALSKTGNGTWIVSGNNTHSGTNTLSSGTLGIGGNSSLGSGVFVLSGGTLVASGGSRALANSVTHQANVTVAGSQPLTLSGTWNMTGDRTLTVNNSATTTITGNVALGEANATRRLTVGGSGTLVITGSVNDGTGTGADGLTKSGTGMLVLSGANTYSGTTLVTAGVVEVRHSAALGAASASTTVSSGATVALADNISTAENFSVTGTGAGGNGALRNLSGNNSITGSVTLAGAATLLSSAGTLTFTPPTGNAISGNFSLVLGGSGNIAILRNYSIGSGTLTKTGTGTLVLGPAATSAASGNISVSAGTFQVDGTILSGGTLVVSSGAALSGSGDVARNTTLSGLHDPGANGIGQQTFSADLVYATGSTLRWQLAANAETGPGTNFDRVLVTGGNLVLNAASGILLDFQAGTSVVNWTDSFWNSDRQWIVLDHSGAGSSTGLFGSLGFTPDSAGQTLASVRPSATFQVERVGNDIRVNYVAIPEPQTIGILVFAGLCFLALRRTRTARNLE